MEIEEYEKEKSDKKTNTVIDKINNFLEKIIGGTIGKTVTILSTILSVILTVKEISLVFLYQEPQKIASYYKISENTPNKSFIIMYYIFICAWGYYTYRKNKGNEKKEKTAAKIFCIIVITLVFTIVSWIVLARNMTFEFENKWLFHFFEKYYSVILFLIFINYLISLIILFFDLTKKGKVKKIQGIFSVSFIFSIIILFLTLYYLLTFGIENKRGYEIFRQNNILKTILYEKNGKYVVAECRIKDNDIIPSMKTLIIDTTTIKETDLSEIERRFKIFRKIEIVNRN